MTTPLRTSNEVRLARGSPPALIRVRNITSTIQGPSDAWGRQSRLQPVSVSVSVYMDKSFGPTSAADAIASDTVHYGRLSKVVLGTLAGLGVREQLPLSHVLDKVWIDLTGLCISGEPVANDNGEAPLLRAPAVRSLEVTVRLPKATLQGGGVSLTGTAVFGDGGLVMSSRALQLHDLTLPILLGVNDCERKARQSVVANVTVERFDEKHDSYYDLEKVIVEAMSQSSFETIEALVAHLAIRITAQLTKSHEEPSDGLGWHLKIAVEKPIAVVFADSPCVELRINTTEVEDNQLRAGRTDTDK